jgi:hypothetical protein
MAQNEKILCPLCLWVCLLFPLSQRNFQGKDPTNPCKGAGGNPTLLFSTCAGVFLETKGSIGIFDDRERSMKEPLWVGGTSQSPSYGIK